MAEHTKVKVCGITNLEDARFASSMFVDYLGFIFYEKSPRYVDPAEAGVMINWLEGPEYVGVFVNHPLDEVNRIAKETGIDLVQLHGNESPEFCELIEKPVIKVIHVTPKTTTDELMAQISAYREVADYYLFDTKIDDAWGGTGQTFDWDKLKTSLIDKPFFLSGGLNEENVQLAIERVAPFAVDVSSSLEEKPGLKDFQKMETFMDRIREVWEAQT
ncbi:MAG: phosphoribosylanthranilate isomerase [Bacteroidota bacterium]